VHQARRNPGQGDRGDDEATRGGSGARERDEQHVAGGRPGSVEAHLSLSPQGVDANLEGAPLRLEYLTDAPDGELDLIVSLLPEEQARAICAGHGVDLDSSDAEAWPRIQREVGETEDVRQVVAAVAAAIDEVFCAANKYLD